MKPKPKPINDMNVKLSQLIAQRGLCCLCGKEISFAGGPLRNHLYATWEHIVPKSKGGTDDRSNLALSHKTCNNRRGNGDFVKHPQVSL